MSSLHGKNYYKTVVKNLRLIVKCGICGHKQKLQFHHIKPTSLNGDSRGSIQRYYDIVKHPDCYIPLCYFCHQKVTLGEISISREGIGDWLIWDDSWDGRWRLIHVI
jgi:hypothetical protein